MLLYIYSSIEGYHLKRPIQILTADISAVCLLIQSFFLKAFKIKQRLLLEVRWEMSEVR
jgi:hypothetical protein